MSEYEKINMRNFISAWKAFHNKNGAIPDFKMAEKWYRALRLYDSHSIYRNMINLQSRNKGRIMLKDLVNSLERERVTRCFFN